jgi:hypothetical protein
MKSCILRAADDSTLIVNLEQVRYIKIQPSGSCRIYFTDNDSVELDADKAKIFLEDVLGKSQDLTGEDLSRGPYRTKR